MPFIASADFVATEAVAGAICAPAVDATNVAFCESADLLGVVQGGVGVATAREAAVWRPVAARRLALAQHVRQPSFASAQSAARSDFTSAQLAGMAALDNGVAWVTVGATATAATELSVSARQHFTPAQLAGLAALDDGVTWTTTATSGAFVAGPDVVAHGVFIGTATGSTVVLDASVYGASTVVISDSLIGAQVRRWARATPAPKNHRQQPIRSHGRGSQFSNASPAELTALQLLRQMVSPADFRRYLRHGFVPVRAESGLVYQVDRHQRISVWDRGERVASLCVHLRGRDLPPTDEVVAKIVIIECDEADIWKRANVSWCAARDRPALRQLGLAAVA